MLLLGSPHSGFTIQRFDGPHSRSCGASVRCLATCYRTELSVSFHREGSHVFRWRRPLGNVSDSGVGALPVLWVDRLSVGSRVWLSW